METGGPPDGVGLFHLTVTDVVSTTSADGTEALLASLAEWDVTRALPRLAERPLLLWHGGADDVVPAETRLQQALQREGLDGNLTRLWETGVRHRITLTAPDATVDFFASTFKRAEQ